MKYLLLIYSPESAWTEKERNDCIGQSAAICRELDDKGQYLSASPLHSVSTATSVKVRDGKKQIFDGPFAETTEQLGGYFLVDVDNLDDAIEIASRLPGAERGTIEIRPLEVIEGLPVAEI